ncbi:MAG: response regulator [Chitinophagaceae bacterium]|nr:response regulator [Chitinophagaceae bacterium]
MSQKKKILIIDDEKDFCLLLKSYFIKKGCDAFIANSLAEGFAMIKMIHPDVIFLDNNLPDGYGWDKADGISEEYPSLKINLISAYKQSTAPVSSSQVTIWEKPLDRSLLDTYFIQNKLFA